MQLAATSARIASDCGNSPGSAASITWTTWPPGLPEPDHRLFLSDLSRYSKSIELPPF